MNEVKTMTLSMVTISFSLNRFFDILVRVVDVGHEISARFERRICTGHSF